MVLSFRPVRAPYIAECSTPSTPTPSPNDFAGEPCVLLPRYQVKNARLSVTGRWLYEEGVFVQALEGKEQTVRALYAIGP